MAVQERSLGQRVRILLPSIKLKERRGAAELEVHHFLMEHFEGYTVTGGSISGYWREPDGSESYGEHVEYTVAVAGDSKMRELKQFLSDMARRLGEECLYLEIGGEGILLYG